MPKLWIDTSCARSVSDLRVLAEKAKNKGVPVIVHVVVYAERRRQMRIQAGAKFSSARFDSLLGQLGFAVFPVDQATAARCADTLHGWYPTEETWNAAKRLTVGGELKEQFQARPARMPMTTDWLISAAIAADGDSRVVTHDSGVEWHALRAEDRVLSWPDAIEWLDGLPG